MSKTQSKLIFFNVILYLIFSLIAPYVNSAKALESAPEEDFMMDDDIDEPSQAKNIENNSANGKSANNVQRPELGLGIGTMTQYFRKVQTSSSGDTNNFKFEPYISFALKYPISPRFSLRPSAGLTIPHSGRDDNITKFTYYLLGEAALNFENWTFKGGPGLSMTYYKGKGGEARLNNGNGYTSFAVPSGNATTRNVILSLGAEYRFIAKWAAQFQTMIFNPHVSDSRAITYSLSAVYFIGLGQ